jgi:hypothetical protein
VIDVQKTQSENAENYSVTIEFEMQLESHVLLLRPILLDFERNESQTGLFHITHCQRLQSKAMMGKPKLNLVDHSPAKFPSKSSAGTSVFCFKSCAFNCILFLQWLTETWLDQLVGTHLDLNSKVISNKADIEDAAGHRSQRARSESAQSSAATASKRQLTG